MKYWKLYSDYEPKQIISIVQSESPPFEDYVEATEKEYETYSYVNGLISIMIPSIPEPQDFEE